MQESKSGRQAQNGQTDIAIVGMACMFPGAPNLDTYWDNILSKVDAITDPPPEAWDSDLYYDPESTGVDRVYCKRAGYLGPLAYFDPLEHGIPPVSVGGEPDQWLTLKVAREALMDAGYPDGTEQSDRTMVVLGKGTYLNHGNFSMTQHSLVVGQTLQMLKTLHPEYSDADIEAIKEELTRNLPDLGPETMPGLIPNIIAGRIANRMDFMGPSYTVDAACASSLVAVDIAMRDLVGGRCDVAVVGGSQVTTSVPIFSIFCQLQALSRKQQIRPFDKDADGTILGEGIGVVVLKRRQDAERDGDRIYALVKGTGISSDGRGLAVMAPRVEGEELALRRAYEMAGISPRTVGLIEAHGTATRAGDAAEIEALTRVFGRRGQDELPWCGVGTVKSMIGHTMPASGIAGLIKAALALHHKVLPPTLNCDEPDPALELEKTPFYMNTESRPWVDGDLDSPRRAGVNAFGFGGMNGHVILEEFPETVAPASPSHQLRWDSEVLVIQGSSRDGLIERVKEIGRFVDRSADTSLKDLAYTLNSNLGEDAYRLAVVATSPTDMKGKLERAVERLLDPDCLQVQDRSGIYFFEPSARSQGRLAFLFPGEASQYPNMLADLCIAFPEVRACFDQIDGVFVGHPRGYLASDFLFPRPSLSANERVAADERLWRMDGAIEGILTANHALSTLLSRLAIRPDAIVGHSAGEYSAMRAAGILDLTEDSKLRQFALDLNGMYEQEVAKDGIPKGMLVAVAAGPEQVRTMADRVDGAVYVAMENCSMQTILVASEGPAEQALELIKEQGLIYQLLPFDRPYHTPLFEPYSPGLRRFFSEFPMSLPSMEIWSCTTASPYPDSVDEIRELAVEHWTRPMEFSRTVEAMYADGVRFFVEVGPGAKLISFVDDILRSKPHVAVSANSERRSGTTQLNHMVGILAAQGIPMQLDYMYERRSPQLVALDAAADARSKEEKARSPMKLATGWPSMNISEELADQLRSRSAESPRPVASTVGAPEPEAAARHAVNDNGAAEEQIQVPPSPTREPAYEASPHASQALDTLEDQTPRRNGVDQSSPAAPGANQHAPTIHTSEPMVAYMRTMERFLETQQEVMEGFLKAGGPPLPAAGDIAPAPDATIEPSPPAKREEPVVPEPVTTTGPEPQPGEPVAPVAAGESPGTIKDSLLDLVSERTGYPAEMLDLDMDMEADLGIDSIKRVEILGEFRTRYGLLKDLHMETVSNAKTLRQIVDFLHETVLESVGVEKDTPATLSLAGPTGEAGNQDVVEGTDVDLSNYPLLETAVRFVPGQELTAVKKVRWDEDLYLHDHTLGRQISTTDPDLRPLAMVPLTMSMEMLAEAAAPLMPGMFVTGMRDIRANRWIAVEETAVGLEIVAQRNTEAGNEVLVKIREAGGGDSDEAPPISPLVEGVVVFSDSYPDPPASEEFSLRGDRPSKWASWTSERLYDEVMFHGPRWHAVDSVERWGEDGGVCTLRVLPPRDFFSSTSNPRFITDPMVLDAAGQVIGFWTMEQRAGFLVFPYHVEELQIYGPNLPVDAQVECRARIDLVGTDRVTSEIDLVAPSGRLWMRLVGWKNRRFDLPDDSWRAILSPGQNPASSPWPLPISSFPASGAFHCYRIKGGAFESHKPFWMRVWARLVLTENELSAFRNLRGPEKRREEWLLGRIVAKDAVRAFVMQEHDVALCPADIEIGHDDNGQPAPLGVWASEIDAIPALSLAHTDGQALAVAGATKGNIGVGVDIEKIRPLPPGFEREAFLPDELRLLDSLQGTQRNEWVIRLWCAKEAVGKCLGLGLAEGPKDVVVERLNLETGVAWATVRRKLAAEFPEFAEAAVEVYTALEDGYAIASTFGHGD